ncbi:DMT family transporter OS=Streptomyces cyaneofuscatus OX=66883 GN=G3I52_09610 PE=4 SV=1 [Streptomyces cyaneofuscatus]
MKGTSSRLTTTDLGEAARSLFGSPYPYLLLFTAVAGLIMSQTALQRCRASLIVPVCTTVTCVFTAVLGSIAFGESLPDDPLLLTLRLAGTALALTVLLAMPRHDPPAAAAPS